MSEQPPPTQQSWNTSPTFEYPVDFSTTRSYFAIESTSETSETTSTNSKYSEEMSQSKYTPASQTNQPKPSTFTRRFGKQSAHSPSASQESPTPQQRTYKGMTSLYPSIQHDDEDYDDYTEAREKLQEGNDQDQQEGGSQHGIWEPDPQEEESQKNEPGEESHQSGQGRGKINQGPDLSTVLDNLQRTIQGWNTGNTLKETHMVPIPIFKGGEQDPLTWLQDFNDACRANNISAQRKLTIIPVYLKGVAYSWYKQFAGTIFHWKSDIHPNNSFEHLFQAKWCTSHQKSRWMTQLRNRIQKPGETVDEYVEALLNLYKKVDPTHAYPAEDHLQQFINGLRDEIREPVEIAMPTDLDSAIERAIIVESTFSRNAPLSAYSLHHTSTMRNNELKDIKSVLTQLTQGFQQLATTQTNRGSSNNNFRRETRTCNKCGKVGHLAFNCRSRPPLNNNYNNRRPFNNNNSGNCYNCNRPGHIASNCPQQKQSNNFNNRNDSGSNNNNNRRPNGGNNRNQWLNATMGDFLEASKQVKEHLN